MDAGKGPVAELYRQILRGVDIPAPESLLRNITPAKAAHLPAWSPYSILTNLAHADFWQQIWLNRLQGHRAASFVDDWQTPEPEQWPEVRASFLANLNRANEMACADTFLHAMESDGAAVAVLLQIALHDAYHLGQITLIKRAMRLESKKRPPGNLTAVHTPT